MQEPQNKDSYFQPSLLCRNGPIHNQQRSMTDIFCSIILFLLFIATSIIVIISIPHLNYPISELGVLHIK